MKTYLLFIFGTFEDHQDIEYFCMDILGSSKIIGSLRYVIENNNNIIVIFDSDSEKKKLTKEIHELLFTDNVKFYFMFERESVVCANLPLQVKEFIFKPYTEPASLKIEYIKKEPEYLNLDDVLDKIKKYGIESLSEEEKNFLDNFEN
jgi:hypothetical protein